MNEKWSDALEHFLLNEKGEVNLSSQVPRLLIGPRLSEHTAAPSRSSA